METLNLVIEIIGGIVVNSNTVKVLDHGSVTLRNVSGPTQYRDSDHFFDVDDVDPANVARMSLNQMDSNRLREQDLKLCEYLMKSGHTSPFEMIQVWIEMKLPIFVARQFVRHRTTSLNEVSGRYVILPEEYYIPEIVGGKAAGIKQGQEDNLSPATQEYIKSSLRAHCTEGYRLYAEAIELGVAPEHARLFLGVNHYTRWIWNQDLHNLFHFLSHRDHKHAQVEAQAYAKAIDSLLRPVIPKTMELYDRYRRL